MRMAWERFGPAVASVPGGRVKYCLTPEGTMETIVRIFAALGAGMILFALTYVTLLVGGIVNGMVVLMAGPIVDKIVARKH